MRSKRTKPWSNGQTVGHRFHWKSQSSVHDSGCERCETMSPEWTTQLKATGYTFFLQEHGIFLTQPGGGKTLAMFREGNRDILKVARVETERCAVRDFLVLMREENARRVLRSPKTGKPGDKQDSRCEMCIEVGGTSRHARRIVAEAAHIDNATVKHSHHCSKNQDLGWCLSARQVNLGAQWAVRHAECIQNFLRRSHHIRHTLSTKHRATLLNSWSEFLCNVGQTMTDSKGSWSVGRSC